MLLSHALFRYLRRERVYMCVYMALECQWLTHSSRRLNSRQKDRQRDREKESEKRDDERTEEGGEGDHVKKSSSFVCQSFYDDTVVIRIYIHYKASECTTRMYLHFNSERTRNLSCTIDLMMWLYGKFVRPSFLDICLFFFYLSVFIQSFVSNTIHHHCPTRRRDERGITIIIRYTCIAIHCYSFFYFFFSGLNY
jgi:hypothetical protein